MLDGPNLAVCTDHHADIDRAGIALDPFVQSRVLEIQLFNPAVGIPFLGIVQIERCLERHAVRICRQEFRVFQYLLGDHF